MNKSGKFFNRRLARTTAAGDFGYTLLLLWSIVGGFTRQMTIKLMNIRADHSSASEPAPR